MTSVQNKSINVVIVGHVDHGKSTLIGRLLYDSAGIPVDKLAEIQKLFEEYKKRFEFAYFLDSFEEELKEERTIDTTRVLFKGKNYYTIVDVPGHKEFVKNMLTGASQAQVAILVVSAPDSICEQTRRHTFLLRMLGIEHILAAINKMDLVNYREDIYDKVRGETAQLLSSLGYTGTGFVPISALEGENVYRPPVKMPWYQGTTLIQSLDSIELEEISEKPLRFAVQDVYYLDSRKVAVGRVEAGTLRQGDELVFQPSGVKGKVEEIKIFHGQLEVAKSGDSIGIVVACGTKRGDVGGHLNTHPVPITSFLGEVVLLEGEIKREDELEIKCGTKRAKCRIAEIRERISSETGEIIEKKPEKIGESEAATIVFRTEPLVVEKFAEIPELGRFILARKGKNIGAGVVLEIER